MFWLAPRVLDVKMSTEWLVTDPGPTSSWVIFVVLPMRCNGASGVVVPMPTLPELLIRMASVPLVENASVPALGSHMPVFMLFANVNDGPAAEPLAAAKVPFEPAIPLTMLAGIVPKTAVANVPPEVAILAIGTVPSWAIETVPERVVAGIVPVILAAVILIAVLPAFVNCP